MLAANSNVSWTKKHSLRSKWNILFDKSPEWISFKPQLGLKVYPCYSCKNMFSSKLTFQDHINRRVIIIKYKCLECTNTFTFYNRCSFLLHTRKHFTMAEGIVDLANVDIHLLPVELSGFDRHESIPFLYDEEEEFLANCYINCQFYTPDDTEAGKQIITLRPFNLVFHYAEGGVNVLLVLKQIARNVPLCEFVTQRTKTPEPVTIAHAESEIKQEIDDDFRLPVISKVESLNIDVPKNNKCSECGTICDGPIGLHFLAKNRPLDETLYCYICKYVAPTKCSLQAHVRIHEDLAPFVCPECGKAYKSCSLLNKHMEDVCFHLAKNVRFRCPAPKCGKLFVLPNTYSSHFINHLQIVSKCNVCNDCFYSDAEFADHAQKHESCTEIKKYNCLVCKDVNNLSHEESSQHINWHLKDREMCTYIFTCKYCRSYFRSTATFAVHKQRCLKSGHASPLFTHCQYCTQRIQYREKDNFKTCIICKQINQVNVGKAGSPQGDKNLSICMLCKEDLTTLEEKKSHEKVCKYNNPVVTMHNLSEPKDTDDTSSSEKMSTSTSDAESKPSNLDSSNDSITDTPKNKKRKRTGTTSGKNKKLPEDIVDLQAEKPISFDGTYYCKFCDYQNTEREEFHGHIVRHRDVSTSYQCMDCGECFVVKPSLIKHLAHFHKITDSSTYFANNDCYDKFAIEELKNNQRMVPGEHRGPVKENQCTVCLEQFEDALSLSKHFRIHGLAFLLKKTK